MAMSNLRLDGRALRVLAHPLRARLLSALRVGGPATATGLADQLDTNTGATSYHLRALAAVDLVVEERDRGTGKERWWRAAQDMHSWRDVDDGDPDARAAAGWLRRHYWSRFAEQAEAWEEAREDWPLPWRENAGLGDRLVHVTADELGELQRELNAVLERYHRSRTEGARLVSFHLHSMPVRPEQAP